MITPAQLARIFPACPDPAAWAPAISRAWQRFGIESVNAQAGFLGIIGNETGGLRNVRREIMTHTFEQAIGLWTKAREQPDVCRDRIAKGPRAFASWIYARVIGNGDEASGDGWNFRGGGIIQITGRDNYAACGRALGVDLLANSDLICADPDTSAAAAAWFVAVYRPTILPLLNKADEASFLEGAKLVGKVKEDAKQRRLAYRRAALAVLGEAGHAGAPPLSPAPPPTPAQPWWAALLAAILRALKLKG